MLAERRMIDRYTKEQRWREGREKDRLIFVLNHWTDKQWSRRASTTCSPYIYNSPWFALFLSLSLWQSFHLFRGDTFLHIYASNIKIYTCSTGFLIFISRCFNDSTECPKIYRKSVLHLLKYRFAVYLSRCSTDLR